MEITKKAKQQLTASPAIIDLQGIVKRFYIGKPNELEILHGIDLQVQEGQFVSIVGESGSGKSTLMNIIGSHFLKRIRNGCRQRGTDCHDRYNGTNTNNDSKHC